MLLPQMFRFAGGCQIAILGTRPFRSVRRMGLPRPDERNITGNGKRNIKGTGQLWPGFMRKVGMGWRARVDYEHSLVLAVT